MDVRSRLTGRKIALIAVTAAVAVILSSLVFVFPDRNGQMRLDLAPGDFYILDSDRYTMLYEIEEITEEGLSVSVVSYEKMTERRTDMKTIMTETEFLNRVYFSEKMRQDSVFIRAVSLRTEFGYEFCKIYNLGMNVFDVGEYNVIYRSGIGGVFWMLVSTSLIYGHESTIQDSGYEYLRAEEAE